MEYKNLLDGFIISNYKSFGPIPLKIGPLNKINFFVGQNNSGKSNILLFVKYIYNNLLNDIRRHSKQLVKLNQIDYHNSVPAQTIIGLPINFEKLISERQPDETIKDILMKLKRNTTLTENSDLGWMYFRASRLDGDYNFYEDWINKFDDIETLSRLDWEQLNGSLDLQRSASSKENLIIFSKFYLNNSFEKLNVELIPAIRRVSITENEEYNYSGEGIITRLAKLQHPGISERYLKEKFNEINKFLKNVLENDSAELEIPDERDTILVHLDHKVLPLSSMGTGIHEVIILAAAVTYLDNYVICIEEPELHLHPLLQKKFIKYLKDHTSNQYLITTHSAHLLDISDTAVFHIKLENGESKIEKSINPSDISVICDDLGYRASDIIQSNCIIWVEGPSDTIYLRSWINRLDNSLIEGIHFSIMFYGGRLLSHLSANDPEVGDFISLRKLNRWISILIDSDKKTPHTKLNSTKQRIIKEFNEGKGFAWVTKGKEIENYIPTEILRKIISNTMQKIKYIEPKTKFDNAISYRLTKRGKIITADKVKLALKVTAEDYPLDILDLKQQLNKIIGFIREANGFGD